MRSEDKKTKKSKDAEKLSNSGKKKSLKSGEKKRSTKFNIKYLGGALFKKMARGGASELGSNADEVNRLNVFPVPDGDTGDNMRMTIESGISAIENTRTDDLSVVMEELSHGMLLGARGNSGVILSQFFAGMAKGLENTKKADAKTMGSALEMAVAQAYSSVMTPTEGTILTVAREAVEYAVGRIKPQSTIRTLFGDLVKEMRRSLERTPELLLALKEANVVDSGGAGLFYIMDGFNRVLNGERVKKSAISAQKPDKAKENKREFGPDSRMELAYCTELLIQLLNSKCDVSGFDIEEIKKFLSSVADSVVAFKTGSIVKVHVHTFVPEVVIGKCREYGEFISVKIENMTLQHTEGDKVEQEGENTPANTALTTQRKKNGVVVVCNGEGVEDLFKEFGADIIIKGGQTHNPSTNDFLEAFSAISCENIFVFPNNGNIFMAASQAAELYSDASVYVINSKSIGAGYVALSAVDLPEMDAGTAVREMEAAMSRVIVGYISPSVRDARINNIDINAGDTIGIIDKEIVVSESNAAAAACRLTDNLLSDNKFMLTAFKGINATDEELATIEKYIKDKFPDVEYYVIDGRQEIYPFIFVAE